MSVYSVFVLAYARLKNISYLEARRADEFKILYTSYKYNNVESLRNEDQKTLMELNMIRGKIMEGK